MKDTNPVYVGKSKSYEFDERFYVSDKRNIRIYSMDSHENLNLVVDHDFEITQEWVEEVMKDTELFKCVNWLRKRKFIQDENGVWNYDGDKPKEYRFPDFFINQKTKKFRVNIGRINKIEKLGLPRCKGGLYSLRELPDVPLEFHKIYLIDLPDQDRYNPSFACEAYYNAYLKHRVNPEYDDIHETYYHHLFDWLWVAKEDSKEGSSVRGLINRARHEFEKDKSFVEIEWEYIQKCKRLESSEKAVERFDL